MSNTTYFNLNYSGTSVNLLAIPKNFSGIVNGLSYSYDVGTQILTLDGLVNGYPTLLGPIPISLSSRQVLRMKQDYISGTMTGGCVCLEFDGSNSSRVFLDMGASDDETSFTLSGKYSLPSTYSIWIYVNDSSETYNNFKTKIGFTINESTDNMSPTAIMTEEGETIGTLPNPTREGYFFEGWYTSASGGNKLTKDTIINSDNTYYAKWITNKIYVGNKQPVIYVGSTPVKEVYAGNTKIYG